MKKNSVLAIAALIVIVLAAVVILPSELEGAPQAEANVDQVEYAQLMVSNDEYVFEVSGTNINPRTFDLNGLYRFLGGRNRTTFTNLLGEIGNDGWHLVDVSQDRTVYIFKK